MFCRRIGSPSPVRSSTIAGLNQLWKITGRSAFRSILRKEVIQPQVPLRLPCYDFTPVAKPTVVACLSLLS